MYLRSGRTKAGATPAGGGCGGKGSGRGEFVPTKQVPDPEAGGGTTDLLREALLLLVGEEMFDHRVREGDIEALIANTADRLFDVGTGRDASLGRDTAVMDSGDAAVAVTAADAIQRRVWIALKGHAFVVRRATCAARR